MTRIIIFSAILLLGPLFTKESHLTALTDQMIHNVQTEFVGPMDALDIVKEQYAANFKKVAITEDTYYYQLENEQYYLAYEEEMEARTDYLIHLYEFVDEGAQSGIGHTVTYGWYRVDRGTGRITEMLQY